MKTQTLEIKVINFKPKSKEIVYAVDIGPHGQKDKLPLGEYDENGKYVSYF